MTNRTNRLKLSGKFLLYTLPPMILCATVYLVLLTSFQMASLKHNQQEQINSTAVRYARILSRPLWNLEEKSVIAIMESLIDDKIILCAELVNATGLSNIPTQGNCDRTEGIMISEKPIFYERFNVTEVLGHLRLVREGSDTNTEIIDHLEEPLLLAVLLLFVIIVCAILGYRFTVTAPLKKITASIKVFRNTGIREKVAVHSEDELGQFVQAYNNSLERQGEIEHTLQQQVTLQRVLLDTIPNAVAFLNLKDEFIGCNRAFSDMFDISQKKLIGKKTSHIFKKNPWDDIRDKLDFSNISEHNDTLKIAETETTMIRKNGTAQIIILTSAITRDDDGKAVGQVSAIKDITDQKRSEVALRKAKDEAENTLSELKVTQQNLIQSEKLASLGSLVAGIAHEINTPLGSSITLSSSISDKTQDFIDTVEKGQLKKSHLLRYLEGISEATNLLDVSLSSAAELVHNFKQVAADQTSSKRRNFALKPYVEEIVSTLLPSIKATQHSLTMEIEEGIELDSYPGPVGQIVTNMFTNATRHAFSERKDGKIFISGKMADDDNITLVFSDNGCGIPQDDVKKVFDPFFTTRMGAGGTGLGMNVVYNIVTKVLGGKIEISSTVGEGTQFTVTFPNIAPAQKEENIQA